MKNILFIGGAGCVIHKDVPPNSIVVNKQKLVLNQNSIS